MLLDDESVRALVMVIAMSVAVSVTARCPGAICDW